MLKDALIEDTIKITAVNKDGKFYEKVSRVECESELFKLKIQLDINTDVYPVQADQYYSMVVLKSSADESYQEHPWMDKYEYVMHGKIFKCEGESELQNVFISFGGLMMSLSGQAKNLCNITVDSDIYLLLRKI